MAIGLALPLMAGCRDQPAATAAALGVPTAAPLPHGDHQPHHGGVVYMTGDLHFEVVLDRQGRHRVYFSDAVRADLPASIASSVTLTVMRPGWSPEQISGTIDEQGEAWRADGAPVETGEATARVAFVVKGAMSNGEQGEPYWIDAPFLPEPAR